jgi:hypothetical protein
MLAYARECRILATLIDFHTARRSGRSCSCARGPIAAEMPLGPTHGQGDAFAGDVGIPRGQAGAARPLDADGSAAPDLGETLVWPPSQRARSYAIELLVVGLAYFAFAKIGLALASIHPSATPIWPPTGLALAAVMLRGYRVWPAIFLAAWLANVTTAGSVYTSIAIACGNTVESVVGGYLIARWSGVLRTFDSPAGVARFALIALAIATPMSATIGVGSLTLAGFADSARFVPTWVTWWLGDLAGALEIAPVLVLWTQRSSLLRLRSDWWPSVRCSSRCPTAIP